MVKKICPICDLPVNATGYCPRCKRIVKHPYLQNADYYLNESHPPNEMECEFHNPYLEADHHAERTGYAGSTGSTGRTGSAGSAGRTGSAGSAGRTGSAGNTIPQAFGSPSARTAGRTGTGTDTGAASQTYKRNPAGSSSGPYRMPTGGYTNRTAGSENGRKGADKTTRNVLAVLLICVISIFTVALVTIGNFVARQVKFGPTDSAIEEYESEYKEFTDEEVIAAGEPCLGYSHFPFDASSLVEPMWEAVNTSGYGYVVNREEDFTDNYAFDEESTYFENIHNLYLDDEISAGLDEMDDAYFYQYISINYDTVTGQLHSYYSNLRSKEATVDFLEQFLTMAEAAAGVPKEECQTQAIMEEARNNIINNQNNYIYRGLFVVEIYQSEDSVYVSIYYNTPVEEYETDI